MTLARGEVSKFEHLIVCDVSCHKCRGSWVGSGRLRMGTRLFLFCYRWGYVVIRGIGRGIDAAAADDDGDGDGEWSGYRSRR